LLPECWILNRTLEGGSSAKGTKIGSEALYVNYREEFYDYLSSIQRPA
jgi:hypothetical protein